MRRLVPFAAAVALLAIVVSGCAIFKPGSLTATQPGGIGNVRLHFAFCSGSYSVTPECPTNGTEGDAEYLLALAVPKGSTPPATVKAVPGPGAFAIEYTRNQEVATRFAEQEGTEETPWPPPGTEIVGYLSSLVSEKYGEEAEWTIDADFGLPTAADGGSYGGPFTAAVGTGWREVREGLAADRPIDCSEAEPEPGPPIPTTACVIDEDATLNVSDLKMPAPAAVTAYVGATAPVPFAFDFSSSVSPPPGFALAATTTLPKATVAVSDGGSFAPGPIDPASHRAPPATRTATVSIPPKAKAGTYDVTLTATAAAGGTVTQVAKLVVTKPVLKLGKAKLNKGKGTATLSVKVPGAGTLSIFGKGVAKVKRMIKAAKAKTVKVQIRAKGRAKAALLETGKAKINAKVSFKPSSGSAVVKTKPITLRAATR